MREIAARDARNRFGRLLDASRRASVVLTCNGRGVSVVMAVERYQRLRSAAWEHFRATIDGVGEKAVAHELTPSVLTAVLADENLSGRFGTTGPETSGSPELPCRSVDCGGAVHWRADGGQLATVEFVDVGVSTLAVVKAVTG